MSSLEQHRRTTLRATASPRSLTTATQPNAAGAAQHKSCAPRRRRRATMSVAGFKLTLWIPVEQVGIVIGRSGQTINKIQGGTSSRLNVVPDQDASAWAPVYIRGAPDGVFAAAQQVVELVDEIDDCVAEFHLGGRGRTLLRDENSGPSNLTLGQEVSADHKVRILIPQATRQRQVRQQAVQRRRRAPALEGPRDVKKH